MTNSRRAPILTSGSTGRVAAKKAELKDGQVRCPTCRRGYKTFEGRLPRHRDRRTGVACFGSGQLVG